MSRVTITRRRKKGKPGQRQARKGGAYERKMAVRLSLWVTQGKRTDCYWRTGCSGGMSTHRHRLGQKTRESQMIQKAHAGDLLCTHPKGRLFLDLFFIELKHQRTFLLEQVFFGRQSSDLIRIWKETSEKAFPLGRIPLVITNRSNMGELVTTSIEGVRILRLGLIRGEKLVPTVVIPQHGMVVFKLADVLSRIRFRKIRKHYA